MSKRIKSTTLKKFAVISGVVGIPLGILLFSFILDTGIAELRGNYTSNHFCGGEVTCRLELNELCFNEDTFIYPMNGSELINARPTDSIESFRLFRRWGKSYREIPMNETCTGSWCGCSWCTKSNTAKFTYAFRKNKCYDIKIEIEKTKESTINWEINPQGEWCGYEVKYEKKTIQVPIYKKIFVEEKLSPNGSIIPAYNITIISGYENKTVDSGKRLGVVVCGETHLNANVDKTILSKWSVPVGDRNYKEYGRCREYEKEKGVCNETELE